MNNDNERLHREVQKLLCDLDNARSAAEGILNRLEVKDRAQDALEFFNTCVVCHPSRHAIPFDLYPHQKEMVETFETEDKVVVAKARQLGMSSVVALYGLFRAARKDNHTVLIVSNQLQSAIELMRIIRFSAENSTTYLPFVTRITKDTIEFANGSSIMARACSIDSVRGRTVNTLIIEEAAFISHKTLEAFLTSCHPLWSVGQTKVIIGSTPKLAEGPFHDIFDNATKGKNGFRALRYGWQSIPSRDEEWAETYRNMLGTQDFATSFEAEFLKTQNGS